MQEKRRINPRWGERFRASYNRTDRKIFDEFFSEKKLRIFYIVCVIFPLMLTDGFILHSVFTAGRAQQQHDMENLASALQYYVIGTFEQAAATADTLNLSSYIENFLEKDMRPH